MKLRILLFSSLMLLSAGSAWADVTINETNFPDYTFRSWLLSQSYGSDGVLTPAEIAEVTSISVPWFWPRIQSLQGIEFFTALTVLNCKGNELTSLDVSKNTALEKLWCYNNQLTSLDVSKNTALKTLDCYENQLTSLDVSKNTALTWLDCSYNQLTSLDVSKNDALTLLHCYDNQLTSLDVSKNTALTELRCYNNTYTLSSLNVSGCTALKTLMCNNNYLTSLDLSKNTALTELNCSRNPLTSLDVSKNTALTRLVCYTNYLTSLDVSKNIELTRLECYDNQLTSLDLSKNTKLDSLYCYNNQLTSLDVSKNTALTMLYCNDNKLTSLDVSKNTKLTRLACQSNQLSSLDVSKNTALEKLWCYNNQLTSLDVSNKTKLTNLYCYSNQLTSLDVSGCTALKMLQCYQNKIKGEGMDAFIESLPTVKNGEMQVIYNKNEYNVMTFIQVAAAKAKGWTPYYTDGYRYVGSETTIDEDYFPDANFRNYLLSQSFGSDGILTYNEMTEVTSIDVSSKSIRSLKGIEYFTALKELYCSGNKLTSLDVSKNTELLELYCYSNQLTSLDVSKNTALTRLDCSGNQLTSLDVTKNTALTKLWCGGNQLTSLDVSKNTALTELWCNSNQLTSLDVSKNTALWYLYCYNNQLTSLDVSKNTALLSLHCYQNQIKGAGMDALVESLPVKSSRTMRVIYYKNEQNVMTTTQVAVAKFRGWTPYYTEGGTNWKEYSGSEPIVEGIAINEKNFPDANFRSWLKSQSYGSDGVLTTEEIAGVTSIDVSSKSIQSLKGIEFFTALTELYCYQNKINGNNMYALIEMLPTVTAGTLDVIFNEDEQNEMNTAQVAVVKAKGWIPRSYDGVKWEEYAGSVSDIAISTTIFPDYTFRSWLRSQSYGSDGVLTPAEIAEVTSISVPWVWPRIQSLQGIEFFTALTELDCSGNELTSLDVSKNTKLTRLHCYSNQLTTLDVSKNTELTWLWCSNNQLTSLDVSGCTALAWLDCSSNQIKGAAMDVLVSSLPNVSSGEMYVMCNENEQNVMTTTQVTAAKAKGWIPYYTNGNIYAGVDPSTAVDNVEAADAEDYAPWYTINGTLLSGKPTEKGIYIHNGKKVIVK